MATIIISLMQKYTREKRIENFGQPCEEFIQFRLYRVINEEYAHYCATNNIKLDESELQRTGNSGNYINKRDVTCRFRVSPGYYLIIPSLFEYNAEGKFLLRVFTEKSIEDNNLHILFKEKSKSDISNSSFFKSHEIERGFKSLVSVMGNVSFDESKNNSEKHLSVSLMSSQSSLSSTSSSLLSEAKDKIKKTIHHEKAHLKRKIKQRCLIM
jgi:hypothetical protein